MNRGGMSPVLIRRREHNRHHVGPTALGIHRCIWGVFEELILGSSDFITFVT